MDILLDFNPDTAQMGLMLNGPTLAIDDSLQTAVLVSLFTDGRVTSDEAPEAVSLGGWWGDSLADLPIGSKLRLLLREKTTNETRIRAQTYAREALEWLLEDGIAADVQVEASYFQPDKLGLAITITKPTGDQLTYRINDLWEALRRAT